MQFLGRVEKLVIWRRNKLAFAEECSRKRWRSSEMLLSDIWWRPIWWRHIWEISGGPWTEKVDAWLLNNYLLKHATGKNSLILIDWALHHIFIVGSRSKCHFISIVCSKQKPTKSRIKKEVVNFTHQPLKKVEYRRKLWISPIKVPSVTKMCAFARL